MWKIVFLYLFLFYLFTTADLSPFLKKKLCSSSILSESDKSDDGNAFLDDLEGTVTVDPRMYCSMLQEVKKMKKIMLVLKRELQSDLQSPSNTPRGTTSVSDVILQAYDW